MKITRITANKGTVSITTADNKLNQPLPAYQPGHIYNGTIHCLANGHLRLAIYLVRSYTRIRAIKCFTSEMNFLFSFWFIRHNLWRMRREPVSRTPPAPKNTFRYIRLGRRVDSPNSDIVSVVVRTKGNPRASFAVHDNRPAK